MALNVGDLLATFGVDTTPAAQGITRAEAMMRGLQADVRVPPATRSAGVVVPGAALTHPRLPILVQGARVVRVRHQGHVTRQAIHRQ